MSLADDGFDARAALDRASSAGAFQLRVDVSSASGRREIFDRFFVRGWACSPTGIAHVASEERDAGGRRAVASRPRGRTLLRRTRVCQYMSRSLRGRYSVSREAFPIQAGERVVNAYFVQSATIAEQSVDGHVRQ